MSNRSNPRIAMIFAAFAVILLLFTCTPIPTGAAEAHSTEYVYLKAAGKSMNPTLTEGDTVKVKLRVNPESIEVGDIIVYSTIVTGNARPEGMWIGHRVVKKHLEDDEYIFRTKGDNCAEADPWKVPERFLLGVVVELIQGNVQTSPSKSSHQSELAMPYAVAGELSFGFFFGILIALLFIKMNRSYSH